jgi:hypothetical protein
VTLTGVWGAFVFGAVALCEPVCDGTCFPCGMFLHCASNADYLYVNVKESWQRMPLLRSLWAKSLSLVGIPAAG